VVATGRNHGIQRKHGQTLKEEKPEKKYNAVAKILFDFAS